MKMKIQKETNKHAQTKLSNHCLVLSECYLSEVIDTKIILVSLAMLPIKKYQEV